MSARSSALIFWFTSRSWLSAALNSAHAQVIVAGQRARSVQVAQLARLGIGGINLVQLALLVVEALGVFAAARIRFFHEVADDEPVVDPAQVATRILGQADSGRAR